MFVKITNLSLVTVMKLSSLTMYYVQDFDEDSFQLVFGNNDEIQQRYIKNVRKHPKYREGSLRFNIALVQVEPPVVYNKEVISIDLPCGHPGR